MPGRCSMGIRMEGLPLLRILCMTARPGECSVAIAMIGKDGRRTGAPSRIRRDRSSQVIRLSTKWHSCDRSGHIRPIFPTRSVTPGRVHGGQLAGASARMPGNRPLDGAHPILPVADLVMGPRSSISHTGCHAAVGPGEQDAHRGPPCVRSKGDRNWVRWPLRASAPPDRTYRRRQIRATAGSGRSPSFSCSRRWSRSPRRRSRSRRGASWYRR